MSAGDEQQTLPLPDYQPPAPVRRRKHRVWPWIVALVVLIGLLVAAWFIAERIARDLVESTIRTQIQTNLALPPEQEIEVDVPGAILPQLIAGTLGEVRIASDDIAFESFEGDIDVVAHGVPVRGGDVADASGEVRMDEEQLRVLMSQVEDFPVEALGIDDPNLTASTEIRFLGLTVPIAIALTPSASEGELVLTPASLQLGDADISADDLRDRFGGLADGVVKDWPVCIAQYIPKGLTLSEVEVDGEQLVARFAIDEGILVDPSLAENGTC